MSALLLELEGFDPARAGFESWFGLSQRPGAIRSVPCHRILGDPRDTSDGYFESSVLDPDGNRIEITV